MVTFESLRSSEVESDDMTIAESHDQDLRANDLRKNDQRISPRKKLKWMVQSSERGISKRTNQKSTQEGRKNKVIQSVKVDERL